MKPFEVCFPVCPVTGRASELKQTGEFETPLEAQAPFQIVHVKQLKDERGPTYGSLRKTRLRMIPHVCQREKINFVQLHFPCQLSAVVVYISA